jgi:hypothetical protein
MISRSTAGGSANGESRRPWLSATGRYVVFQSTATNLVAVDANGRCDVFRHDRDADGDGIFDEAGAVGTILVSVSTAGIQGDDHSRSYSEAISDDGDVIAFQSDATNLLAGGADTNGLADCFARTVSAGTTVRVSVSTGGAQASGDTGTPAVSGDGLAVVFCGGPSNLVPGDTNGGSDVFLRVLASGTTMRVSVQTGGAEAAAGSSAPRLSGNGQRVAFESYADNLVTDDTNGVVDVFVHDRATVTTVRASCAADGTEGNDLSFQKGISADGEYVAFYSWANNWPPPDLNGTTDIFRRGQPFAGPGGGGGGGGTPPAGWTFTILHPAGATMSWSYQASGDVQAGFANFGPGPHAGIWSGTAASWLDLNPPGASDSSRVFAVAGAEQAGYATFPVIGTHAGVWSGDAVSWSDLNPAGATASFAHGTSGTEQVGYADFGAGFRAGLWSGSAASWVDLNPAGAVASQLRGTTGTVQAGHADFGGGFQAGIWSGTPGSWANLHALLPAACTMSESKWISNDGGVLSVVGFSFNSVTGEEEAVLWTGPGGGGPPPEAMPDPYPATFSVNGPVDPHTKGIRYARGTPPTPQIPPQPGNPVGYGIRVGAVAQATSLPTPFPGDVSDYDAALVPSEAVMFQSPPLAPAPPGPPPTPPDGTNNQILEASAMGLVAGLPAPTPLWTTVPPERDNIDAFSFGEDYFPASMVTGLSETPYPPPLPPMVTPWAGRVSLYDEPIVVSDAPGVSFRFSVNPWAIGAPGTAVLAESGGADAGAGLGPWTSPGDAAGDVFGTPVLLRVGGATVGGGTNMLVHDNPTLALSPDPAPLDPAEDDLDALECIGDNTFSWITGALLSAVRTQFAVDGGAGADIYVTAPGLNLLFLDNLEIGLMPEDDLDALILHVCPQYRSLIAETIRDLVLNHGAPGNPWTPYIVGGDTLAYSGPGLSMSIVKYLGLAYGVQVGFSVTTDSQGLEYTAVDWEAGPVVGGVSAAAGDIFYAQPGGGPINPNYLWYEETDIGEATGSWVNGGSIDLADLSDNLDGLDSYEEAPDSLMSESVPPVGPRPAAGPELAPNFPNPFCPRTRIAYSLGGEALVLLAIHDVQGRRVATLVDEVQPAGRHEVDWEARDDRGERLVAGTYLARLEAEGEVRTRKIVLIK